MTKRAAIYLRVSSDSQTVENQRPEVEQLAPARGSRSSTSTRSRRAPRSTGPSTSDAEGRSAGKFGALVSGRSTASAAHGRQPPGRARTRPDRRAASSAYSEPGSTPERAGPELAHRLSSPGSRSKRARLVSRTRQGLERARRQGPRASADHRKRIDVDHARELRAGGKTLRQVAADLGIGVATLHRALAATAIAEPHVDAPGAALGGP